jgi:hypothetical protein
MYESMTNVIKNLHIVNETPQADIDKITNIMFDYKAVRELEMLGSGAFGNVYKIVGESGFEYAVKFVHTIEDDEAHDAEILEQLQGTEGFLKLFFYIDGTIDKPSYWEDSKIVTQRYLIMVTPRVNGYTISSIREDRTNKAKVEFLESMNNNLVGKLSEAFQLAISNGIKPIDLHQGNMMFNVDTGMIVVVDTGNFEYYKNSNFGSKVRTIEDDVTSKNCVSDINKFLERCNNDIRRAM